MIAERYAPHAGAGIWSVDAARAAALPPATVRV